MCVTPVKHLDGNMAIVVYLSKIFNPGHRGVLLKELSFLNQLGSGALESWVVSSAVGIM